MIIKGTSCYANAKSGNLVSITESGKIAQEEIYDLKPRIIRIITMIVLFIYKNSMHKTMSPHGDYDHMGEAINLVSNFKVEKDIFNCGEFNELKQDLIEVLNKKKVKYYSCVKELNINDNKLYFLNNKNYGNENDNSSVIYTELNNHKFLFMGDAGVEVENIIYKILMY